MASLARFSPVARAWFEAAFAAPTAAQEQGGTPSARATTP